MRPARPWLPWAGAGAAIALAAGCSLLVNPKGDQCDVDGDCAARGGAFAGTVCRARVCVPKPDAAAPSSGAWDCLGNVKLRPAAKPMVDVAIPLRDFLTQQPVKNMTARPCAKADTTCMTPLGPTQVTDDEGVVHLQVPAGFDGYVELVARVPPRDAAPGSKQDAAAPMDVLPYVPSLLYLNPPVTDDATYTTTPLVSPVVLSTLALQAGDSQADPSLGLVFFEAHACDGKPAAGVTALLDVNADSTRRFFFVNGLPTESSGVTDPTGYGGFINVPVGIRTVTASRKDTGAKIGIVSALVRRGWISYTVLPPLP